MTFVNSVLQQNSKSYKKRNIRTMLCYSTVDVKNYPNYLAGWSHSSHMFP